MRKTAVVLLGIVSGLLLICHTSYASNRLHNASFANGPYDWEWVGIPWDGSSSQHRTGTYSVTQQVSYIDNVYWSQLYQEIAIKTGQPVYGRVYAKSTFSPLAGAKAGIMLQFFNDSDVQIGDTIDSLQIGGTVDAWRRLEVNANSAPAGATKVRFSLYLYAPKDDTASLGAGWVYFDDAFFDRIKRENVLQTSLLNAGFVNGVNDWQIIGNPSSVSPDIKYAGSYAARNTVTEVSVRDYWGQLYEDIACSPGRQVTGRIYAKTDMSPLSASVGGIQLEFFNAAGSPLQFQLNGKAVSKFYKQIGGQTDWRKLASPVLTAPSDTAKLRFSIFVWAPKGNTSSVGGIAYFDSAYLTIAAPAQAQTQ